MTDEEILKIAATLWQQAPGVDFTMDKLVAATGISRATLYRRFGGREGILQRLAERQIIDVQELSLPDIPTRILQATRVVVNRTGFSAMTVEQIAQEAGVGAATIYRHFGNREALLTAFMHENSPRELLRTIVASPQNDLEGDLLLLATAMLEFVQENGWLARMFFLENLGSDPVVEKIRNAQGRTVNVLASYLESQMNMEKLQRADPFALALSFTGMILGLGVVGPQSYHYEFQDARESARLVTQLFLHGIGQIHPQPLEQQP